MQKISTILTIALLIAVAVLYYLHFSLAKGKGKGAAFSGGHVKDSLCNQKQIVAYVELDSLNTQVNFIKSRKSELETEQKAIVNEYENSYANLETEKNNFLKKGNAITQQEYSAFEDKLRQRQQEIEGTKQMKGQKLAEKGAKVMEDMQNKLKDFLNEYNKDKRYNYILATGVGLDYIFYKDSSLNITNEIIKGLNEKIKSDGK